MTVPIIDFKSFTVEDIRQCLLNNGYITIDEEFGLAKHDGMFKFVGY